jgi:NAD(P)-dependent dehydrogenase (short-subunit alcohol dehydrogenase family)
MTTPFDLGDKVAIVTGSSRGISRGSAEAMARLGAKVVVSSRKADACEAVARYSRIRREGAVRSLQYLAQRRDPGSKPGAMQIARRRGMKKAIVALAHRLAMIMHRIWVDGTEFRWTGEVVAA